MFGRRSGTSEARVPAPGPAAPAVAPARARTERAARARHRQYRHGKRPHAVSLRRAGRAAGVGAARNPRPLGNQYRTVLGRFAPLRHLLRGQGRHLRRADRGDRSRATGAARHRFGARRNPRHRQRDHRDQEHRDVDLRAGRTARRYLQRRARLRPARAAALARRHFRRDGERLRHGLHRSQRQDSKDQHSLPRQSAAAQYLPAHRQPDRPPRRRIIADLRRALARR